MALSLMVEKTTYLLHRVRQMNLIQIKLCPGITTIGRMQKHTVSSRAVEIGDKRASIKRGTLGVKHRRIWSRNICNIVEEWRLTTDIDAMRWEKKSQLQYGE